MNEAGKFELKLEKVLLLNCIGNFPTSIGTFQLKWKISQLQLFCYKMFKLLKIFENLNKDQKLNLYSKIFESGVESANEKTLKVLSRIRLSEK